MNQFSIRSIRRELDLTLDRLAEILRVSARQLWAWENGLAPVPVRCAERLERFRAHGLGLFEDRR